MDKLTINDETMYRYFEDLLYGENSGLRKEWKLEQEQMPYGLTDYDVRSLLGAKQLLYGEEDALKQICLLETMQKFLHEYVGIDGLEELLVNNYGTIENSIFFEHDSFGKPANIREHSKHQMKNAYLGSVLLLECGYLEEMAQSILQGRSRTTRYLCYQAKKVLGEDAGQEKILGKLEEWSYKIFMVSSMLHDIGYPLEYYLRSACSLTDYPPYLKLLSPTVKTEFSEVKALLMESQLFRQVDQEQIREKYQRNNHGVLSAISLLLHFYHGGRIYSLTTQQQCIVEMSAIAIYHHTDRFRDGNRMVYLKDPVSYMVRLCDDLQEWNRFKIIINDKHNYLQCPKCGKLLQENGKGYLCGCSGNNQYTKVTRIRNRKMTYICLCDRLEIEREDKSVRLSFDFDLLKQIEILLDDYPAVIKHDEDLKKVENLIADQAFSPQISLKYFVSNNPQKLMEKLVEQSGLTDSQILERIEKKRWTKVRKTNVADFYRDFMKFRGTDRFGGKLEKNSLRYEEAVKDYVRMYYGEIHSLYELLHKQ